MKCEHRFFGEGCIRCGMSQADRAREAEDLLEKLVSKISKYLGFLDELVEKPLSPAEYLDMNRKINTSRFEVQGIVDFYKNEHTTN